MSAPTPNDLEETNAEALELSAAARAAESAPAPEGAAVATAPPDELETLRREVAELRDKNLRLLADARNLQQRTAREKAETLRYAEAEFARDLLVILDDLERTLQSAQAAQDVPALAEGVRIVHEHFLKLLRDRHIQPIEALGRPFDPDYHEALLRQPSSAHPPGTVIREVARGYKMHDRVLRPARVVVSAEPPPASGPGNNTDSKERV